MAAPSCRHSTGLSWPVVCLCVLPAATAAATTATTAAVSTTAAAAATATTSAVSTTTTAAAVTAATTTATTATTTSFTRAGFVNGQGATGQFFAVQGSDGRLGFFRAGHFDEAEAARTTGVAVGCETGRRHGAISSKSRFELTFGRVEVEVTYIDVQS